MTTRRTAVPPDLPGFTFLAPVGSGGFADVYLFEQHMPRRRVAVKVLHVDRLSGDAVAEFATEANLMALLSTHPSIVTIHDAGEAPDGRPYLVMEYAPKPTMAARIEQGPLPVAEALRVGVQISAAVETAHRAGIMHRDIKPANILVTEYGRPALTDFGIASTSATDMARGMSIPWSAPEMFAENPYGGPAADTYSLAATLFTLLSGFPPYQGVQRLSNAELIRSILTLPAPALDRRDAPPSLAIALRTAMAKDPAKRPASSLAFARMLQKIEIEMGLSVTQIDIIDDSADREIIDGEADGFTRVRGVMDIAPQESVRAPAAAAPVASRESGAAAAVTVPRLPAPPIPDAQPAPRIPATRAEARAAARAAGAPDGGARPAVEVAVAREVPDIGGERRALANRRTRRLLIIGAALAVAAVLTATVVSAVLRADGRGDDVVTVPQDVDVAVVPAVTDLTGTIEGDQAVFTWTNPSPKDGDSYMWRQVVVGEDGGTSTRVTDTTVSVPVAASGQTCVSVAVRRAGGTGSTPVEKCAG